MENKKLWQKPELVIIIKNTPEESVLGTCKTQVQQGPNTGQTSCLNAGGAASCQGHSNS
jgi:hypothetical protein